MTAIASRVRPWWPLLFVPLCLAVAVLGWNVAIYRAPPKPVVIPISTSTAIPSAIDQQKRTLRLKAVSSMMRTAMAKPAKTGKPGEAATTGKADRPESNVDKAGNSDMVAGAAIAGAIAGLMKREQDLAATMKARQVAARTYDQIEQAIAEQAKQAHVAIEVDPKMQVGREYSASLIIEGGAGKSVSSLAQMTPEPIASEFDVEIAPNAEAYISSSQIDIQPITPARQAIRAEAPTIWQWTVKPRRDGDASMMFILLQHVRIGAETFAFPVRQFPQVIKVELTWWLWAREMALSFWGAITALLVAGASAATIYNCWKGSAKTARQSHGIMIEK